MEAKRVRRLLTGLASGIALLLGLAALGLLSRTSQDPEQFGRLNDLLLLINALAAAVLLLLIVTNLARLWRDYRIREPGARLKARMLAAFVGLSIAPLLVVWFFAVQFLNQGIDNWFDVQLETGLGDALELSRESLDGRLRDDLLKTRSIARALAGATPLEMIGRLSGLRREADALEVTVFGDAARIIATSALDPAGKFPELPVDDMLLRVRRSGTYVGLDPVADGNYRIRAAVLVPPTRPGDDVLLVQAIYPLGGRLGTLADSVEQSFTRYGELTFLREPLRNSFIFTLTLVVLLSFLAAAYGAFFFARRLVAPIQSLAAGTRAVAAGDLESRLPVSGHDEVSFLIDSFNDMTQRLASAREAARASAQLVERERARLAAILARLSTGVIVLEGDGSIRIANEAAGQILGVNLSASSGLQITDLAEGNSLLTEFIDAIEARGEFDSDGWREQLSLRGDTGRRVLVCAATRLPAEPDQTAGQILVFDDITALLQAQRDAAWGEVARRLAHEIKNPLTPIQLSAERIRRRYLGGMQDLEAEVLDRATSTIVQQVEAMRDMVNAFSEYARAPELAIAEIDLNQLVREVSFLYQSRESGPALDLSLDAELPQLMADAGRLRQLLHNLLRNAQEALDGHANARIVVATSRLPDQTSALLEVADNGPGILTDELDEIFEPYVTTKPKGSGLGLAIVKKLVEEHGGSVTAENPESGGARIRVRLPLKPSLKSPSRDGGERITDLQRERA